MKNVLVMGINGTFGGQMTNALLDAGYDAGYKVTAFLRDTKKLPEKYKHIKTVQGDVKNLQSIRQACE
ncbi:MAG: NAD(P)H-binding protein, partial [Gammaproteobacteria bacterium]|nr:NAD(P)H-binding protein [Gammaproteobacteria bacterium]